jgi:hypothetical protein
MSIPVPALSLVSTFNAPALSGLIVDLEFLGATFASLLIVFTVITVWNPTAAPLGTRRTVRLR